MTKSELKTTLFLLFAIAALLALALTAPTCRADTKGMEFGGAVLMAGCGL